MRQAGGERGCERGRGGEASLDRKAVPQTEARLGHLASARCSSLPAPPPHPATCAAQAASALDLHS